MKYKKLFMILIIIKWEFLNREENILFNKIIILKINIKWNLIEWKIKFSFKKYKKKLIIFIEYYFNWWYGWKMVIIFIYI